MTGMEALLLFLGFLFLFLMSVVFHEVGHAWVADRLGDPTAREAGRITLSPLAHLDPFGTVLLPLLTVVFLGFPFGAARPVPVNPARLRRPRLDDLFVTLAGPGANFFLAAAYAGLFHLFYGADMAAAAIASSSLAKVLVGLVYANLLLGVFNLVPIPPLDGGHVLAAFLPRDIAAAYRRLGAFGLVILLLLVTTPGFGSFLSQALERGFGLLGLDLRRAARAIGELFAIPREVFGG